MSASVSSTCSASAPEACEAWAQAAARAAKRFINDDACGDYVLPVGDTGLEFQAINALSAVCFIAAGAPLIWRADTPIARAYGLMMCGVGLGSFSYHATTSASGFIIDIVPMAVTAALMIFRGVHALQVDAGETGQAAETTRFLIAIACSFFAVYIPWALMAAGISHSTVWGVWALMFGSMGAVFGVISLMVFFNEGILHGKPGMDLAVAIACVLLGLGCSVHSFVPGLCEGWRTALPLHALWHVFSSVTANRCGYVLDTLTKLVSTMEEPANSCKKQKGNSLLVRLLKRDMLPSQFSM
mmetsp:Transcript_79265/g.214426  ORF Transcript_79265/g.214426 Transcript_79265/m.214426 type:complete len:299 (+) Transcript_79265:82-978(+)